MKILMVLAPDNFRDEEYFIPREIWEQKGHTIQTFSKTPLSIGRFGRLVHNDFSDTTDIPVDIFDGIFWVGGGGCLQYINDESAQLLCKNFVQKKKTIGAICAAPRLLLHWQFLKGKKCTGWDGDQQFNELAKKGDALFIDDHVYLDSPFVTADGPESAEVCALAFLDALENNS